MKTRIATVVLSLFLFTGCAEMTQIAQTIYQDQLPLSQTEIIAGLKQALTVGVDSSVAHLAKSNGYLKDEAVKILLPPEADVITENLGKLPGGQQLVDKAIESINEAASDAAKDAAPIIANSIKTMTIQDAAGILSGGDFAATNYLEQKNYEALFAVYQPKIENSLDKNLLGNISAQQSWDELTGNWNKIAGSTVGQLANMQTVETNLSSYLTRRALDGLFIKIRETEKSIRQDPAARVTELLKRVFGNQ